METCIRLAHHSRPVECPLSGLKQTSELAGSKSVYDPKRTSTSVSCCNSEAGFSPYQSTRLSRYDAVS